MFFIHPTVVPYSPTCHEAYKEEDKFKNFTNLGKVCHWVSFIYVTYDPVTIKNKIAHMSLFPKGSPSWM